MNLKQYLKDVEYLDGVLDSFNHLKGSGFGR